MEPQQLRDDRWEQWTGVQLLLLSPTEREAVRNGVFRCISPEMNVQIVHQFGPTHVPQPICWVTWGSRHMTRCRWQGFAVHEGKGIMHCTRCDPSTFVVMDIGTCSGPMWEAWSALRLSMMKPLMAPFRFRRWVA